MTDGWAWTKSDVHYCCMVIPLRCESITLKNCQCIWIVTLLLLLGKIWIHICIQGYWSTEWHFHGYCCSFHAYNNAYALTSNSILIIVTIASIHTYKLAILSFHLPLHAYIQTYNANLPWYFIHKYKVTMLSCHDKLLLLSYTHTGLKY